MLESQRLVTFGRVSVPVELGVLDATSAVKVKPVSWICLPDEHNDLPQPTLIFLEDMERALRAIGIHYLVDISTLPKETGAEANGAQVNIVLPTGAFTSSPDFLELLWALKGNSDDQAGKFCYQVCMINGKTRQHESWHCTEA
ncbi:unnamed protein product [Tilletia controversa]|uniref:Uncharacterized protein n=4 Tax=Tilletia TaxID=13289 RepID=A0A8X7N0A2_9BASI|nr:hypothetical protein CF336_g1090 [Tilletia laevis]KAE8204821.1 hypothetical protein CF328_g865 [Tilletia controversa]CAD6887782.1 unnamed protein product [Tilletia caries]KAE8208202.1 hypothetical protein CF335_g600 [Tilletia laevis]KAE8254153.1 hypothetical protein A4X06_0g1034 [Tilletia controversa]